MKNILISAYACEPGRGSEGEIGWSLVHEIAKSNRVWVITRANNQLVHEAAFSQLGKPDNLNFIYYDLPKWARWYKKGKRFFLVYYYLWQIGTYFEAKCFIKHQEIDLTHHLTGGMDWMPSGLAFLNYPFLWGPVGSEEIHPNILPSLPLGERAKEIFRKTVRNFCRNIDPLVRLTGYKAKVILSHTPENLPKRYRDKIVPYIQTGIHPSLRFARMKSDFKRGNNFTVIYAGELIHWKGAAFAVDAFLDFSRGNVDAKMIVIGDGPLRSQLEHKVTESGVNERIVFHGRVSMETLTEYLTQGDIFLYPSYHHGLATVVLQAMLTGLPIVCLEGDAIGRAVTDRCGVTVTIKNDMDFIQGLSKALLSLYQNESTRIMLAKKAQKIAIDDFSYASIGKSYQPIYESIIHKDYK